MFYFDNIGGKKILKSSVLSEFDTFIKHLFTTKESFIRTKEPELINTAKANRELILDYLKIKNENLFKIKQTHSTNIKTWQKNNGKNTDMADDTDGVILYKPGSATILNFADCTPVVLYDPKTCVAAGLHAGWRGTAGAISRLGVKIMKEKFNSKPENIIAVIGPCIGQEDFETGLEVYEALKCTVDKEDGLFQFKNNKVYPDLAGINARQLTEEGVKTIDISQFKTYKDNDVLFSYRRENGTTSRISVVLKLV